MNRSLVFAPVILLVLPLAAYGQAGGFHFTSTIPHPRLRTHRFESSCLRKIDAQRLLADKFVFVNDLQKVDHDVLTIFHSKVPARDIANSGERFNPTASG